LPVRAAVAVGRPDGDEVDQLLVEGLELRLHHDVVGLLNDREEDRQVEQAALGLGGAVVGALPGVDEGEGFVKGGHDVVDLVPCGGGPVFDLGSLGGDARLLGVQDVDRDGVTVVELDQLLLLGGQFAQAADVAVALAAGDEGLLFDVVPHSAPDLLAFLGGQPVGGVNGVELFLDRLQADVAGAAGAAGGDAAEAGVVLVVDAPLAAVAAVAVGLAAAPTAQLAGEVVVVLVAAAATGAMAVERGLGTVEGVLVDERVVAATELDAAVGDDAEVVVVAQHPVHRADRQRLGGAGGRWSGAQPGLIKNFGDRA